METIAGANLTKHLTLVGKYLSVLNCLRKEDKKKVVKNRIIDQKRTSGM